MPSQPQYDEIGLSYESLKAQPAARVERANLRAVITPLLLPRGGQSTTAHPEGDDGEEEEKVSVLDLACGTGFYSRLVLSWGASRVVGVDISSTMIEAAKSQSENSSKLNFFVGDCSRPLSLSSSLQGKEQNFDIVLGAWLLNYASSPSELEVMFENISSHLKPGGHFIAITPHPATDLDSFAELFDPSKTNRDQTKYGATVEYVSRVPGGHGYRTKVTAHVKPREISFESFHLKREVYEKAARDGGLGGGKLKWVDVQLPQTNDESKREYGVDLNFWDGYLDAPHFGILVIQKEK